MEILKICGYAEGHYSGATYEESITIPAQVYYNLPQEAKEKLENLEFYVGGLDGKHSEVCGNINLQFFTESEIEKAFSEDSTNDGYNLWETLESFLDVLGINLAEENKKSKEYINSLDLVVEYKCKVRKSKINELKDFVGMLNKEK